ncbi:hypothetical protein CG709_12405 [Lachnotalea glycerini]|nr:hypothetical protein CG709_12405 [Lachnotalea glycerini]
MITTEVGVQGLQDYEKVIKVENKAEAFADTLIHLYQSPQILNLMTAEMPQYINRYFSFDAAVKILRDTLSYFKSEELYL